MEKEIKQIIISLIFASVAFSVQAQDRPDLNRELNLEKEYNPNVQDANKINRLPEIKAPEAPKSSITFSNYTLNYLPAPYLSLLNPPTYLSDFATSRKRGYLMLGVSSLLDLNGDLGYQILNSEKDQLSIFASHRSTNSKVDYLQSTGDELDVKMNINDNLAGLDYLHRFGKVDFSADVQYTHSVFNNYNVYDSWHKENDKVNNLFAYLGVASVNNKEFIYQANITYTLFKQKYNTYPEYLSYIMPTTLSFKKTEHRLLLDGNLFAQYNSIGGIGIAGIIKNYRYDLPAGWDENYDFHKNYDYTTFSAIPYFTFEGDNWDTHLGLNVNIRAGGISDFMVAPDVRFQWHPTKKFRLYLQAEGGIRDNSNYSIYYENRYANSVSRISDAKIPMDGTLGLNFSSLSGLEIDLFTGYKWMKDEHFYDITALTLEADAQVFKLGGVLKYTYQSLWDMSLRLTYNYWKLQDPLMNFTEDGIKNITEEIKTPLQKPAFIGEITLGTKIPNVPLRVDLSYHLEAGRKCWEYESMIEQKMKDIHALNLKATYSINDTFNIFAQSNNLLFQKYDIWYGYPAQNFNIMGGISIKF